MRSGTSSSGSTAEPQWEGVRTRAPSRAGMMRGVIGTGPTRFLALTGMLVLGLAACGATAGGRAPAGIDPAPRVLSVRDHGRTVSLALGRTVLLRVPAAARGRAVADGRALLLVPIENVAASRYREWEIRAARVGSATISAPRADGRRFRITIRVTAKP